MKKLFTSILSLCLVTQGFCQSYSFHSLSPFEIRLAGENGEDAALKLMFIDRDHDGDLDLIMAGIANIDSVDNPTEKNIHYFITTQTNIGSKKNPLFGPRENVFADFPYPEGYFFPSVADLNNDGLMDFIISSEIDTTGNQQLLYYRNNSSSSNISYDKINALQLDLDEFIPQSFFSPEIIDLDHDGDEDLLMSGYQPEYIDSEHVDKPVFLYAKNLGTPSNPSFLGWFDNPFNLNPKSYSTFLTGGDVDLDGDIDLIGFGTKKDSAAILYYENRPGANGKPHFLPPLENPFGLPATPDSGSFYFPALVDIDGDGDLDFFIPYGNTEEYVLEYYQNDLINSTQHLDFSHEVEIYPNPAKTNISIVNKSNNEITGVVVFNITGQIVDKINSDFQSINIGSLIPGVYVVQITSGNLMTRKCLSVIGKM